MADETPTDGGDALRGYVRRVDPTRIRIVQNFSGDDPVLRLWLTLHRADHPLTFPKLVSAFRTANSRFYSQGAAKAFKAHLAKTNPNRAIELNALDKWPTTTKTEAWTYWTRDLIRQASNRIASPLSIPSSPASSELKRLILIEVDGQPLGRGGNRNDGRTYRANPDVVPFVPVEYVDSVTTKKGMIPWAPEMETEAAALNDTVEARRKVFAALNDPGELTDKEWRVLVHGLLNGT